MPVVLLHFRHLPSAVPHFPIRSNLFIIRLKYVKYMSDVTVIHKNLNFAKTIRYQDHYLLGYNAVYPLKANRSFGEKYRLHLHGRRISKFACHIISRWYLVQIILQIIRWRRYVPPKCRLTFRVRVEVTLRLAVYRQSVRLGVKSLETRHQYFMFQLNTCGYSPYVTSSLTRGWVCRLQLLLVLASEVILVS
jgi:hypothetical protein